MYECDKHLITVFFFFFFLTKVVAIVVNLIEIRKPLRKKVHNYPTLNTSPADSLSVSSPLINFLIIFFFNSQPPSCAFYPLKNSIKFWTFNLCSRISCPNQVLEYCLLNKKPKKKKKPNFTNYT